MAVLILLILCMLLGTGIGNGLAYLLGEGMGLPLVDTIEAFSEKSSMRERNFVRAANLFTHLFTFTLPAILVTVLLYRSTWARFLRLQRVSSSNILIAGIFFMIGIFILSQFTYWLNQQLPLPEWATEIESSAGRLVKGLLVMETPWELAFTILIVAVLPAVGEELVFRGILQQELEMATGRPVAAIWIAALIFSAFHLQFAGLLPRFLLGAGLGYLFYWTRSLWTPIVAHFAINGMQVAGQYYRNRSLSESSPAEVNWPATALAVLLVAGLSYYLYQHSQNKST